MGFTELAGAEVALWRTLERLCGSPVVEQELARRRELAERYAWAFFFRQMVPLPWLREAETGHPAIHAPGFEQELAERGSHTNQVLDFIVHGPSGQLLVQRRDIEGSP